MSSPNPFHFFEGVTVGWLSINSSAEIGQFFFLISGVSRVIFVLFVLFFLFVLFSCIFSNISLKRKPLRNQGRCFWLRPTAEGREAVGFGVRDAFIGKRTLGG